jgi:hypothetical protein
MAKQKYCETLKPGFYLCDDRCIYASGTTKGNKWIYLDSAKPEWNTLMWNCIEKYAIDNSTFHQTNPTQFTI